MRAGIHEHSNHRSISISIKTTIAIMFVTLSAFRARSSSALTTTSTTFVTTSSNLRRNGIRSTAATTTKPSRMIFRRNSEYVLATEQNTQLHMSMGKDTNNPFGENSPFSMGSKTDPTEFRSPPFRPQRKTQPRVISVNTSGVTNENGSKHMNKHSSSASASATASASTSSQPSQIPSIDNLKEELERFRTQQSKSLRISASRIFTNKSLEGICESLPTTNEELLLVQGIGPKKVEMFGTHILTIVSTHKAQVLEQNLDANRDQQAEPTGDDPQIGEMNMPKLKKTQLKEELREYRMHQAGPDKPAYTVFTNAALEGIYASLPMTKQDLLDVKGIGPKKVEMFGDDILEIVSKYASCQRGTTMSGNNDSTNVPIPRPQINADTLSAEQKRAAEIALGDKRQNIFITGSAGTGKSHLLKYLVQEFKEQTNNDTGEPRRVGICAPTGVAAIIIGGTTLHSFFGIGLGTGSISSLVRKVSKSSAAMKRIDETDVLIIDECSMLSSNLLEKLDAVTRMLRKDGTCSDEPFGGMQVIAFGDFFQLPPVERVQVVDGGGDDNSSTSSWKNRHLRAFCFDSDVWSDLGLSENVIELKEIHRQEHIEFISLLDKVRVGKIQEEDVRYLNSKCLMSKTNPLPKDGILPTRLYVLNKDVDMENISRLNELKSEEVICQAVDRWRESMPFGTIAATKKQMKDSLSLELPDEVRLKVGAQVMLTRNKDLDNNLVNGSRGVIERFVDGGDFVIPIVRFDDGIVTKIPPVESFRFNPEGGEGCLVRMQVPLKLAWAITIHKSQGSTLSRALLDISSAFEYGQCYVALSRVRSLEGLWLERPARLRNIMVSPQVLEFFGMRR